jgi:hypothetical protein
MKKVILLAALLVMTAGMALAATYPAPDQSSDVLGAHLIYGRGCAGCHVPHSGPGGNGQTTGDPGGGNIALWGQNMAPLYGQTLYFGDGNTYAITLPNTSGANVTLQDGTVVSPVVNPDHKTEGWSTMACLSCHDGNMASSTFMKGSAVESVTIGNATFKPKTLLGNDGSSAGNYHNDHPVGPEAKVGCSTWDWDCTLVGDVYTAGTNQKVFFQNYLDATKGVLSKSNLYDAGSAGLYVQCTTCHDQHSMNAYKASVYNTSTSAFGYQTIKTTFFLRGYYDPNTGGNNTAQFCRQCHGGEANEQHGVMSVPTT